MLTDLSGFWAYDNRENLIAEEAREEQMMQASGGVLDYPPQGMPPQQRWAAEEAVAAERGGGGGGGGKSASSKSSSKAAGRAAAAAAAAAAAEQRELAEHGGLPAALRGTREHVHYVACRQASALRMREVASVFAHTIEGIGAQLTPARAASLAEELRREAELSMLVADAKTELGKLRKVNRDLASDLNAYY